MSSLAQLISGDGYKSAQEKDLKQVLRELDPDIPAVCVCGNHDIGDQPTPVTVQNYRDSFGDDYFVFWVGGVKCIVINSQYYENRSQVNEFMLNLVTTYSTVLTFLKKILFVFR